MEYPSASAVRGKFKMKLPAPKVFKSSPNLGDETEDVREVLNEMLEELYKELREQLTAIINQASKGGSLQERTIESMRGILDRVTDLNFVGDVTLTRQVDSIRRYLLNVNRKAVEEGFIDGLTKAREELSVSVEEATKEAEAKLTGLGRRKLSA
jgi:hypothetical protein